MMEHRITRIFVLLESIDFSKMRDEFESASACKKIEAGGNALNIALDIVRQYGPTNVIDADVFPKALQPTRGRIRLSSILVNCVLRTKTELDLPRRIQ